MKLNLLLLLLVSLAPTVFGSNEGNIYSAPIVKRLGIREPPTVKLDRSYGNSSHERRLAAFLDKQCARHREMTLTLNEFFLTHPHLQLSVASFAVSNLNAVINSKAFVKLSKSNHNILMASDRQLFCQQLERDLDRCYQDLSFFRDYDTNHAPSATPVLASARRPVPRFSASSIPSDSQRKKWNVSKADWLMLQEANRNFPHDRENYLRQHPYDPHFDHYEPPKIFFGDDGHLRYESNYP